MSQRSIQSREDNAKSFIDGENDRTKQHRQHTHHKKFHKERRRGGELRTSAHSSDEKIEEYFESIKDVHRATKRLSLQSNDLKH